ncbi:MAG TPA: helix-turn-helix transcriptional regulator [Clostridiaceae bacterium]|nr:helix-turn-helix transcriptional regulator [Clostridiaceae bacterium]
MHFFSLVAYLCSRYTGDRNAYTRELFYLADTISYMENNFPKHLKVKDLAERANLSERHFSRVFVKNYHISPIEYIIKLRLQYAKKLLKIPDLSISQIAELSGFYNSSAFSRKFKEVYGLSPSKYRQLLQIK